MYFMAVWMICLCPRLCFAENKTIFKTYKFGVTPYMGESSIRKGFQPVMDYLSKETGIRFELVVVTDYTQLAQRMKLGEIDIGAFSPFAYLDGVKTADVRIFASHIADGGKASYNGLIIARKDSGVVNLENLKGKSFAFVDPKSASGFIYPRAILISKGINPSDFFSRTAFLGNHENVLKAVLEKSVDAGAVYTTALKLGEDKKLPVDKLCIIAKTDPIPYDAYTVRKDIPEETVRRIQKAMLQLDRRTEDGKRVLDALNRELKIDGFISGDDRNYNVVREAAAFRRERVRVAVLPFREMGTEWKNNLAPTVTELFESALIQSEKFWVSGSSDVLKTLKVDDLDPKTLNSWMLDKLDQELKARIVLSGNIIHLGSKINMSVKLIDSPGGAVRSAITKTGTEDDITQLVMDVIQDIGEEYPVTGYVIVSDKNQIMVDFGSEDGVKEGMPVVVYRDDKLLTNPLTGEVLGRQEEILAEAQAMSVTPKVTTCRIMKGDFKAVTFGKRARTVRKNETIIVPSP